MTISMKPDLRNKIVLVTGACGGIGQETVKKFIREGAIVIATDFSNTNKIKKDNENVSTYDCDITKEKEVYDLVKKIKKRFSRIDVIVHCAGIFETTNDENLTLEAWEKMIKINLTATFIVVNAVFKEMKKQESGKIICLASNAGQNGGIKAGLHYSASKGGVIAYAKRLAQGGAKHNILVNIISPGPIKTQMTENIEHNLQDFPLGRMGSPEDIAEVAIFLSSQGSNFITGQTIGVNGGILM